MGHRRGVSHVGFKVFVYVPSLINGNSSAPILRKPINIRLVTSIQHVSPACVEPGPAAAPGAPVGRVALVSLFEAPIGGISLFILFFISAQIAPGESFYHAHHFCKTAAFPVNFSHRVKITSQYFGSSSMQYAILPDCSAAMSVEPEPPKRSSTMPPFGQLFPNAR